MFAGSVPRTRSGIRSAAPESEAVGDAAADWAKFTVQRPGCMAGLVRSWRHSRPNPSAAAAPAGAAPPAEAPRVEEPGVRVVQGPAERAEPAAQAGPVAPVPVARVAAASAAIPAASAAMAA